MYFVPRSKTTGTIVGPKIGPFATLNPWRAVDNPRGRLGSGENWLTAAGDISFGVMAVAAFAFAVYLAVPMFKENRR